MICTRKEFCDLAGITNANLTTYVKREKVFLESDGKTIDTKKRENADFLKGRESKGKAKVKNTSESILTADSVVQNQSSVSPKIKRAAEKSILNRYELELNKLQAEYDKKIIDTKLAEQRLSTLLGNNIPIDVVKMIVAQLSKSLINNYKSFSEQQITEFCHKFRIEDSERVKLISKNTTGLNNTHQKAVNDARIQINNSIGSTKVKESEHDGELDN